MDFNDMKLYIEARRKQEERMDKHKILVSDGVNYKVFVIFSIIFGLIIYALLQTGNTFALFGVLILSIAILTCFGMQFNYYCYYRVKDGIKIKSFLKSTLYRFKDISLIELDYTIDSPQSYSSQSYMSQGNATFKVGGKSFHVSGDIYMKPKIKLNNGRVIQLDKKQTYYIRENKNPDVRNQQKETLIKKEIFRNIAMWKYVFQIPENKENKKDNP